MSNGENADAYRELCWLFMELLVNVGLVNTVIGQTPEEVQESWRERLGVYQAWAQQQSLEVQMFGDHFDQ